MVVTEALDHLVSAYERGLLYLDMNDILFREDGATSCDDIHQFLTHLQFHLLQTHRNEICVYKHQGTKHAILAHRPGVWPVPASKKSPKQPATSAASAQAHCAICNGNLIGYHPSLLMTNLQIKLILFVGIESFKKPALKGLELLAAD